MFNSCRPLPEPPLRSPLAAGNLASSPARAPTPRAVGRTPSRASVAGCAEEDSRGRPSVSTTRDRRPEANAPLFVLLSSGVGLRQAGRTLRLDVHAVQKKFRKVARHLRLLNRNLVRELPAGCNLLLDEIESYEQRRITPLTIPVLIDGPSKMVITIDVAPIRRVAQKGSKRRRWLDHFEAKHGKRDDRGHAALRRTFVDCSDCWEPPRKTEHRPEGNVRKDVSGALQTRASRTP